MRGAEILSTDFEGTMDVEQPRKDRARPQLSGVGSPTLVARLDVVADHADHLFRLHPPCRLCAKVPWHAVGDRLGIPIGLLVIVSAFLLTGIYVSKANSKYDPLIREIVGGNRS